MPNRARVLKETFLGPKHFSVVDSLQIERHALHKLDRHDEEQVVFDRLYAADVYANNDDEYGLNASMAEQTCRSSSVIVARALTKCAASLVLQDGEG